MHTITIDGGTSNTRLTLWRGEAVVARRHSSVGVRDNVTAGSDAPLRQAVREGLRALLQESGVAADAVSVVLASGMIGARSGLHEVPHVEAPAGLGTLADGMRPADLSDVWPRPIWFIPGVRHVRPDLRAEHVDEADMMRGEEVEAMGWMAARARHTPGDAGAVLLVLPGSHTKVVHLSERGEIQACMTTMAGELLQLLTQHSLLAATLGGRFAGRIDEVALLAGARLGMRVGLSRAAFTVRSLALFTDGDHDEQASFLLGIVLAEDARALGGSRALPGTAALPIRVAGKAPLAHALTLVLRAACGLQRHIALTPESWQTDLAGRGALQVASARGLLPESSVPESEPAA